MINQKGIGLVELMVSITIAAFVLAGVVQLYLTSTQNVSTFEGSSRIQENARYVFTRLEKDIGRAGNLGCFSFSSLSTIEQIGTTKVPKYPRVKNYLSVGTGSGALFDFSRFIDGVNDGGPGAVASDSLLLRFASPEDTFLVYGASATSFNVGADKVDDFDVGQVVVGGDCSTVSIFSVSGKSGSSISTGTALADSYSSYNADKTVSASQGLAGMRIYGGDTGSVRYFVGTSAAGSALSQSCTAASPQYCALFRETAKIESGAVVTTPVEIVEGIQDFQILYGRIDDDDNLILQTSVALDSAVNGDGDSIADYVWSQVDRVKVSMVLNSINNASTNEGAGLLTRSYSRVFTIHNQLPACLDCKGAQI